MTPDSAKPSPPRSRFTRERRRGMRLQERDAEMLCGLFLHRVMTRSQIMALFGFGTAGRCNVRLRQLFDAGLVTRFFPAASSYGAEAIYSVGGAAAGVVAERLEMDTAEVRRHSRVREAPLFLEHTLAIVDFHIALRRSLAAQNAWDLERWEPELRLRHEWQIRSKESGPWRTEAFKPDAFFRLRTAKGEVRAADRAFFLEIDRGHQSQKAFEHKLGTHVRYLASGLFRGAFGDASFQTLVVTSSTKRLNNLKRLAEPYGEGCFLFTTFQEVAGDGPLGIIGIQPPAIQPAQA